MTVTLLEGHVVDVLAAQPANHWHVCVTSPPYLWLRSYSTVPQAWEDGWQGELGQEPSPELYVEHLVAVFRAVKRVLRDDGTLWVNLAGCYFNDPGGQNGVARLRNGTSGTTLTSRNKQKFEEVSRVSQKAQDANRALGRQKRGRHPWLKPLDWVDVPGLFAQAMQRDGWCWRSDVVWVKPSALPESVFGTRWERCRVRLAGGKVRERAGTPTADGYHRHGASIFDDGSGYGSLAAQWADCPGCLKCQETDGLVLRRGSGRPTKATERVMLFVKGPGYWFDQEAVREANTPGSVERWGGGGERIVGAKFSEEREDGTKPSTPFNGSSLNGRNLRDWWVIGPEPLKDAHYAAYPSELPSRCIRAGTSEWGCCPRCGAPWARVVEQRHFQRYELPVDHEHHRPARYDGGKAGVQYGERGQGITESTTLGWRPTCRCPGVAEQAPVPCRVLDPFSGSGTTLLAANRLGRDATGVDLKPAYNDLARKRLGREPLSLFAWRNEDTPEEVEV